MYRPIAKTPNFSRARILPSVLLIGGGIVGLGTYLKGTLLLKHYGRQIQLHSDNRPVEPSVKLEDMVLEVCDNLGKSISENTPIQPILIPGTRTTHCGTMGTFQGGIIGLPSFFEFNKIEEIKDKVQFDETSATNVEEIYNTFLLSDEAKKYGIAREILLVNTPQLYFDVVLSIMLPFVIDKLVSHPTIQSEIVKVPSNSRNLFYVSVCIFGLVVWRYLHMKLRRRYENKAENKISQLGEDYNKGAIEYNTKLIQRNISSATIKGQDSRILKKWSDLIDSVFSPRELPHSKLYFHKCLSKGDDQIKNNV